MSVDRAEDLTEYDVPKLLRTIEALTADVAHLRAEKAERDTSAWLPLKVAADKAGCTYETARTWAAQALAAGRQSEARKVGGRVIVNVTDLIAHRMLLTGKCFVG